MSQSALSLKQQVVSEIKDAIQNSKSVSIVEYRGLNVEEVSDLRNKYRAEGVSYKVFKNTMVKLALQELGYEGYEEYLTGPNGFVFSNDDMVAGPRVSADFAKANDKLVIKAGLLDGKVLNADEVKALAKLPTRDVLVAQVLGMLNAPIAGFANVLQGSIRKAVYALNAVKEKKEQEA